MKLPTANQFGKAILMTVASLAVINRVKNMVPVTKKLLGEQ